MTTLTSPSGSASRATRRRTRFLDRPPRNTLLAATSLVVLAVAALFLVGSPASATASFSLSSYAIPGSNIVVYGTVTTASDHAVGNAQVEVYRIAQGHVQVLQQMGTSPEGLYRVVLRHLNRVVLYVKVSTWPQGPHYQGTMRFLARPGQACRVSARLLHHGSWFFLPISSY